MDPLPNPSPPLPNSPTNAAATAAAAGDHTIAPAEAEAIADRLRAASPPRTTAGTVAAAVQAEISQAGTSGSKLSTILDALPTDGSSLGSKALATLKMALGDAWTNKLSDGERQLLTESVEDLADLTQQSVLGGGTDVSKELAQIEAQMVLITSIEADRIKHYVYVAVLRTALAGVGEAVKYAAPYLLA